MTKKEYKLSTLDRRITLKSKESFLCHRLKCTTMDLLFDYHKDRNESPMKVIFNADFYNWIELQYEKIKKQDKIEFLLG